MSATRKNYNAKLYYICGARVCAMLASYIHAQTSHSQQYMTILKKTGTTKHAGGNGRHRKLPEMPRRRSSNTFDEILPYQRELWQKK